LSVRSGAVFLQMRLIGWALYGIRPPSPSLCSSNEFGAPKGGCILLIINFHAVRVFWSYRMFLSLLSHDLGIKWAFSVENGFHCPWVRSSWLFYRFHWITNIEILLGNKWVTTSRRS
jgi:hypothetical protein